jgi:hypothetical protein
MTMKTLHADPILASTDPRRCRIARRTTEATTAAPTPSGAARNKAST